MIAKESIPMLEEKHLLFLDDLRESGITNMFGAVPYLQQAFLNLSYGEASNILGYWMKSFNGRHSKND